MAFDAHTNFAYSLIVTPPDPSTSGTMLILRPGDALLFPAPPFNATVSPPGAIPQMTNAEIVRVVSVVGDSFNILRAQENTTVRAIAQGDQIVAGATVKTLVDIEQAIAPSTLTAEWVPTLAAVGGGLPSYASRTGTYLVDVKGQVVAPFSLQLSSRGSLVGALQLGGLPVPPAVSSVCALQWDDPGTLTTLVNLAVSLSAGEIVGTLRPLVTPPTGAFLSNTLLAAQVSNAFLLAGTLIYRA